MTLADIVLMVGMVAATVSVTRLLLVDEFPPVLWLRQHFIYGFAKVDDEGIAGPDIGRWGRLAGAAHAIAYLWTCPWCMSVWVGAAIWGIVDWATPLHVPYPWLILAAGRLAAGAWSSLESWLDLRYEIADFDLDERRYEARGHRRG